MTIMSSSSNPQHNSDTTTTTATNIIHHHHHQQHQQRHNSTPFIRVPPSNHSSIRNRNNSHENTLSSAFQIPWSPTMMNSNESLLSSTNPTTTTTSPSDRKTTNDQVRPQKVVLPAEPCSGNSSIIQHEFSRQSHVLLSQRETVQRQQHNNTPPPLASQQQEQSDLMNMIPSMPPHGSDTLSSNRSNNHDNTGAGRGHEQQQQSQEYNSIDIMNNNNYPDSSSCSSWEQQQQSIAITTPTTTTTTTTTRNQLPNDNVTSTTTHYPYDQNSKALQSSQYNNNESSNHITPNPSMFTGFGNVEQLYNSSHIENSATATATAPWATETSLWSKNGTTDTPYSASSSSTSNNSTTQHQHPTSSVSATNTTTSTSTTQQQQQQQHQHQQQRYLPSTNAATNSQHSQPTNNNNTMNSLTEDHFSLDFLAPPPPAPSIPGDSSQTREHSHSILSDSYNSSNHTSTTNSGSTIETATNIRTLDQQQYHPRSISPLPLPPVSAVSSMNQHNNNLSSSTFEIFDSSFLNNSNNTNNNSRGGHNTDNNNNHNNNKNSYHQQVTTSGPSSSPPSSFNDSLLPVRAIPMSNVKAGARTARMMVDAAIAAKLRPQIQSYLLAADPVAMGERTVVILTGKVAQKSYGTEKRFLCPPPTVILDGASWWTNKKQEQSDSITSITANNNNNINSSPPQLVVSMSGETSETQEGQVDWYSMAGTTVGQTGFGGNTSGGSSGRNNSLRNSFDKSSSSDRDWYRIQPRDPLAGGKCVLRQLYINDADDKRKRVECLARLQLADGTPVGTLASKPVKVISKPSKKRLSVKNMDSCIHHGTTVSLFNRIRSQTVSTKYLGVSASAGATSSTQPFMYPGQSKANHNLDGPASTSSPDGTCFIARTGSWDPFIIWLVDTTWVPQHQHERENNSPDEYIGSGASTLRNDIPYPPPPAIAAKNKTGQPLAVHYNQHIVLQCLTTGLVSPVMIIRKIDRASTVVGGASSKYYSHYNNRSTAELSTPSGTSGGEYGDEILGDPVSQLHKVALQIVQDPSSTSASRLQQENNNDMSTNMFNNNTTNNSNSALPRVNRPVTYLACLNDMVGMHRSAHDRKPIRPEPPAPTSNMSTPNSTATITNIFEPDAAGTNRAAVRRRIASTGNAADYYYGFNQQQQQQQSMYSTINFQGAIEEYHHQQHPTQQQHRQITGKRSRSVSAIDQAINNGQQTMATSWSELGAYWSEDVSDSAVWTIVGTDCAKYTFWELPSMPNDDEYMDNRYLEMSIKANQPPAQLTIAPVPTLLRYSRSKGDNDGLFLSMHGGSFTRDLEVWFGDVRSPRSEYRGREHLVCEVPMASELAHSVGAEWKNGGSCSVPLLLVRRNGGALYKTNKYYTFC